VERPTSALQVWHNPSRHKKYDRPVLSSIATACRWSLLLLSPLLSAQPSSSGGKSTRIARATGPEDWKRRARAWRSSASEGGSGATAGGHGP
jgi:hypothetical protein